ncbi:alkyl sulfatase C-terminal domain-containing protein [Nocardia rhamnosiphila]|uniref:alkyl sulfatase C-terminal domain-containing protein n=1 Tax=Nocardia rhamnosiphila TaxID=426716 RepID=UPI00379A7B9D
MITAGQANTDNLDTILAMPIDLLFDYLAVHIIGDRAAAVDIRVNTTFTDTGDGWTMWVRHGVLNARSGHAPDAQLMVPGPKASLAALLLQPKTAREVIEKYSLRTDGDISVLDALAGVVDEFDPHFNIATP